MTNIVTATANMTMGSKAKISLPSKVKCKNGMILHFKNEKLEQVQDGYTFIDGEKLREALGELGLTIMNTQAMLDQILTTKKVLESNESKID